MKQLWAPWRLEYVRRVTKKNIATNEAEPCVFCDILNEDPAPENLLLCKTEEWGVVLNRFPYNSGHVMLVPRVHVSDLKSLPAVCQKTLGQALSAMEHALTSCYQPHGINCGINLGKAAGAGIPDHVHFHMVPRWLGDTNFMPILSEVRCINDHLFTMYRHLQPHFLKTFEEWGRK